MLHIIHDLRYHCANGQSIEVEFARDGNPAFKPFHRWYGLAQNRERTIDLRVGDKIFVPPDWQEIIRIEVMRDEWVDEVLGDAGFVLS